MDSLEDLIKGLYGQIADHEAILAGTNLVGFFRKLESIDERLLQEGTVELASKRGNELNNENFRS